MKKRIGKHQVILSLLKSYRPGGWYPEEVRENDRQKRVLKRYEEMGCGLFMVVSQRTYRGAALGTVRVDLTLEPVIDVDREAQVKSKRRNTKKRKRS